MYSRWPHSKGLSRQVALEVGAGRGLSHWREWELAEVGTPAEQWEQALEPLEVEVWAGKWELVRV